MFIAHRVIISHAGRSNSQTTPDMVRIYYVHVREMYPYHRQTIIELGVEDLYELPKADILRVEYIWELAPQHGL